MSDILRACGMLARAWESENDPRNTELGVAPDVVREMSVAAQKEWDLARRVLDLAPDVASNFGRQRSADREIAFMRAVNNWLRHEASRSGDQIAPDTAEPAEKQPDSR